MMKGKIRWFFIFIFFIIIVNAGFFNREPIKSFIPFATVLSLLVFVFLHGKARYGLMNTILFFVITFIVSNFFEALSIKTGFPFGFYYYDKLIGPRIFDVPILIMPAYFGMGYASWILSHILLNQFDKRLLENQIFLIPLVATMIMVMWDLCMDPIFSNIDSLWIWPHGGAYFGVPLQNYFGWFLVVFIIFQLFAFHIARYERRHLDQLTIERSRLFWLEIVAVYGIQGLLQLLNPLTQKTHLEIYGPMALVTIFTMMFVVLISFLMIKNHSDLY